MSKLRVLDLFSGIGGFSLGLERTGGFETVAFCEIEEYPRRVLEKHWPGVPIYHDVRTLTADTLRRDGITVDVICGGFPCQDLSFAGKRAGLEGARSGLWGEYRRLIGELRPRFVIVENVPGLLSLGMATVLGDLAALGYDAIWDCIPAAAVGAPHIRDRVWIVAYPDSESEHAGAINGEMARISSALAYAAGARYEPWQSSESGTVRHEARRPQSERLGGDVADAPCGGWFEGNSDTGRRSGQRGEGSPERDRSSDGDRGWSTEPDVGRVAARLSPELDGGRVNDEAGMECTEGGATVGVPGRQGVRAMRVNGSSAATPSRLHETDGGRDPLSGLSCEGRSGSGNAQNKTAEGLQGLRQGVHAKPQQEAQHLQRRVSFGHWPHERDEALGIWEKEPDEPRVAKGVKDRVARLRSLGNAVVPQIPELIGKAILEASEHGQNRREGGVA